MTSEFLPVSLLTRITHDLRITEGTAGELISAKSIAAVVTSLFVTSVTQKVDRQLVHLALSLSLVLSNALVVCAPKLTLVMLARIFIGKMSVADFDANR